MKKWISVLLAVLLACTACPAFAEEDLDALVDRGNEALNAGDYATALELYTRAADAGNARGINNLGWLYQNGLGVEQDYEKAADWFHKAVELGETNEAQVNYDKLIEEGKNPADYVPKDISF